MLHLAAFLGTGFPACSTTHRIYAL